MGVVVLRPSTPSSPNGRRCDNAHCAGWRASSQLALQLPDAFIPTASAVDSNSDVVILTRSQKRQPSLGTKFSRKA